jgi:hypothetical protein
MQLVDFVETCCIGQTDFIVVQLSVTNNGLSSNNRFLFHDSLLKVSRILESMCSDFVIVSFYFNNNGNG